MTRRPPRRPPRRRRERGAALLTAMIIVTLVATLATAMVWQQWRAVRVESAERARTQAAWILAGALDFGMLILNEDANSGRPTTDLTQPWATPLAESRLSTFLSADTTTTDTDDGPEAFLSGTIADAQAKFNLTNLATPPAKDTPDLQRQALVRLCQAIGLDPDIADRITTGMRAATAASAASAPGSTAPLTPATTGQLTWFGIDPTVAEGLDRYLTILPSTTAVNVNTAGKEVLAGVLNIDPGSAERLLAVRQRTPFKDDTALKANLPQGASVDPTLVAYRSDFFEVGGRLRLADHVVSQRSLVRRRPRQRPSVLQSRLVSSVEELGPAAGAPR